MMVHAWAFVEGSAFEGSTLWCSIPSGPRADGKWCPGVFVSEQLFCPIFESLVRIGKVV